MTPISILADIMFLVVLSVAGYQFRNGKGYFYRTAVEVYKQKKPEINEIHIRKYGPAIMIAAAIALIGIPNALRLLRKG